MATSGPTLAGVQSGLSELRKRLFFVLFALLVYRIGTHIPVPGINPDQLKALFESNQGGILDLFNMFSGGALERMSILALGVMPYITSSIIMNLLSMTYPALNQLRKEGEAGRRKITQYTRYGTVVIGLVKVRRCPELWQHRVWLLLLEWHFISCPSLLCLRVPFL